jgi:hypothetical protein
MTLGNTVTPTAMEAEVQAAPPGFEIPDALAARYDVRMIQTPDSVDRRIGLFLSADRINPVLEIGDNHIVAHNTAPETIAALVKLAQHNDWEAITVEGSPEFRKAVWAAASREFLTVTGYEPTFAEAEQMSILRREAIERRKWEPGERPVSAAADEVGTTTPYEKPVREDRRHDHDADRRRDSEDLAEVFLHTGIEPTATNPRLSNALHAQAVMEQHIAELFQGDAGEIAMANDQSRQMISDVLRRGMDASVRKPTPVRHIEPSQHTPELGR